MGNIEDGHCLLIMLGQAPWGLTLPWQNPGSLTLCSLLSTDRGTPQLYPSRRVHMKGRFFKKSILSLRQRWSLFKVNVFKCYKYCKKIDDDYISLLNKRSWTELKSVIFNHNVLKGHWYLNSLNTEVNKCIFLLKIWNVHFAFIIAGLLMTNLVFFYTKMKR